MVDRPRKRREAGFTLIELSVVLVVVAGLAVMRLAQERQEREIAQFQRVGNNVAQVVAGLRAYLSENPGLSSASYSDLAFLRNASCPSATGTASKAYIACETPDNLGHPAMSYTISIDPGGPNGLSATLQTDPITIGGDERADLAGVVAETANGFNFKTFKPTGSSTFYQIDANPSTATVEAVTGTQPSADAWLRVDGSNDMEASLEFAAANDDIVDAGDVEGERFVDDDDNAFYVDPASRSQMNEIETKQVVDKDNNNFYVDPSSRSNLDQIYTGEIFDLDGSGWKLDPSSQSDVNQLRADQIRVDSRGGRTLDDLLPRMSLKKTQLVGHQEFVPGVSTSVCPIPNQRLIVVPQVTTQVYKVNQERQAFEVNADFFGSGWWVTYWNYVQGSRKESPQAVGLAHVYCVF